MRNKQISKYFIREGLAMKKWVTEDWEFELTATDGKAGYCRLGLEKGDKVRDEKERVL
jgi:hypothetical protein